MVCVCVYIYIYIYFYIIQRFVSFFLHIKKKLKYLHEVFFQFRVLARLELQFFRRIVLSLVTLSHSIDAKYCIHEQNIYEN